MLKNSFKEIFKLTLSLHFKTKLSSILLLFKVKIMFLVVQQHPKTAKDQSYRYKRNYLPAELQTLIFHSI